MPLEVVKELIKTKNKKGDVIFKQPTAEEKKKMNQLKAERDAKKAENAKPEVSVPPTVIPPTVKQTTAPINKTPTPLQKKQTPPPPVVKPAPPVPVPPAKSANDLSTFIKDSELLIISDFEGTTPKTQFEKFAEYARGGGAAEGVKKKVIYLGDVFDSTVLLKSKESTESKEGCVQDDNYCALQSVKLLVDNPTQCKYVVGNRDLNKIKLLPFFQFKTGEKWWNPAGATSYESIVDKLLAEDEKDVWLVGGKDAAGKDKDTTMDFFKPFWSIVRWNTKESITARATKNYTKIYDRFEALFGADGVEGTMSAINTLKSIPNEMFASRSDDMTIETFIEKLKNKPADKNVVRAALVITLFMRMLDKDLWKEDDAMQKEKKVGDFGALDGYLYKYITEAKPAYYADYAVSDQEKNLLLFAHGGITKDFVTGKGTKATELLATVKWDEVLNLQQPPPPQTGGAGNPITDSIDNFNGKYNELLTAFFAKKYEGQTMPAKLEDYTGMLTLLQLSAAFGNPKIKDAGFSSDVLSPIQKKDASDQNLDEFISPYNKIYNIFGHASTSTGYSFGKSKDSAKTYFINTDYSSTLFKADISCDDNDSYNKNYLQLKLDTAANKLYLEGSVTLNSKYKQFFGKEEEEEKEKEKEKEEEKEKEDIFAQFLTEDKKKLNPATVVDASFNYYIVGSTKEQKRTDPLTFTFPKEVNLLPFKEIETKPPQFIFNGIAAIDDKKYEVYSSSYAATTYGQSNLFIFSSSGNDSQFSVGANVLVPSPIASGGSVVGTVTTLNPLTVEITNPITNTGNMLHPDVNTVQQIPQLALNIALNAVSTVNDQQQLQNDRKNLTEEVAASSNPTEKEQLNQKEKQLKKREEELNNNISEQNERESSLRQKAAELSSNYNSLIDASTSALLEHAAPVLKKANDELQLAANKNTTSTTLSPAASPEASPEAAAAMRAIIKAAIPIATLRENVETLEAVAAADSSSVEIKLPSDENIETYINWQTWIADLYNKKNDKENAGVSVIYVLENLANYPSYQALNNVFKKKIIDKYVTLKNEHTPNTFGAYKKDITKALKKQNIITGEKEINLQVEKLVTQYANEQVGLKMWHYITVNLSEEIHKIYNKAISAFAYQDEIFVKQDVDKLNSNNFIKYFIELNKKFNDLDELTENKVLKFTDSYKDKEISTFISQKMKDFEKQAKMRNNFHKSTLFNKTTFLKRYFKGCQNVAVGETVTITITFTIKSDEKNKEQSTSVNAKILKAKTDFVLVHIANTNNKLSEPCFMPNTSYDVEYTYSGHKETAKKNNFSRKDVVTLSGGALTRIKNKKYTKKHKKLSYKQKNTKTHNKPKKTMNHKKTIRKVKRQKRQNKINTRRRR